MLSLERNTRSHTAATFSPGNGRGTELHRSSCLPVQTMWNDRMLDASLNTDLD